MSNTLVQYFTGRRLKDVIRHTPKKNVSITYHIYEEWEDVFSTTLMCGNKREKTYTTRVGVSETDRLKISTLLEMEGGLSGTFKIKGKNEITGEVEHKIETMQEQTHTFALEAPIYGKQITSLYQLKNIIEIHYEEKSIFPWARPTILHRTVTSWQKRFDDQTQITNPHPDCSPPDSPGPFSSPVGPQFPSPGGPNMGTGSPIQIDLGNGVTYTGDLTVSLDGLSVPEIGLQIASVDAALNENLAMIKSQLPGHLVDLVGPSEHEIPISIEFNVLDHSPRMQPGSIIMPTFEGVSLVNYEPDRVPMQPFAAPFFFVEED